MRVALFYHSLLSDWNHGNAHFLRGIATELMARGHQVRVFEPQDSWSYRNLTTLHGDSFLASFYEAYPGLSSTRYDLHKFDLEATLDASDLVLVHEWNTPELIRRIAEYRKENDNCRIFFHDTHHRSVSDSSAVFLRELESYDGILAFGESVSDRYRRLGWGTRVWTWHEAADTRLFHPIEYPEDAKRDLVWIGNWGDGERSAELEEFLLRPARELELQGSVYGVRYPPEALSQLASAGLEYRGWVPNFNVAKVFAQFRATVHIPRKPYTIALPGIPTIRVFEALACGIPMISTPWQDSERLFQPGSDFLVAHDEAEMKQHLKLLLQDKTAAREIAEHGRRTILSRHTCRHRVDQLLDVFAEVYRPQEGIVAMRQSESRDGAGLAILENCV